VKPFAKNALVAGAGIVLLGTSLALSSAAAVSGASQSAKKSCDTSGYCLTEDNKGGGGGITVTSNSGSSAALDVTNDYLTGIYAHSVAGAGVIGLGSNGPGIVAETNTSTPSLDTAALQVEGSSQYSWLFNAVNRATNDSCYIDPEADLRCSGTVGVIHKDSVGNHVIAYASESATETIEDVATARISGGLGNVRIDPSFASVMDHQWYYVFLTPLGDTRGLYVSMKTATGFQVRETGHGRDSLAFDYRIVAHPLGAQGGRLPAAPTR
jgi:hypothetical protein